MYTIGAYCYVIIVYLGLNPSFPISICVEDCGYEQIEMHVAGHPYIFGIIDFNKEAMERQLHHLTETDVDVSLLTEISTVV